MADENKPQIRLVQSLEGDDVFGPVESVTGDDGTGAGTRPDTVDFMLGTGPAAAAAASDTATRMQNITPGAQPSAQPAVQVPTVTVPPGTVEATPAPFKFFGMDIMTIAKIALGGALIYLALAPEKKSKLESLAGNIHRVDIEGEGEEWEDDEDEDEVAAAPEALAGKPKPKKKRKPRKPKLKMAPPAAPLSEAPMSPAMEPEIVKSVPAEAKVVA